MRHLAAIDAATGVPTAWNPNAYGPADAIAVCGSKVCAGGAFQTVGGLPLSGFARLAQ